MNTLMLSLFITSLTMSAVIVLLLFFNKVLRNKVPAVFRYYMWLIVLLGLLVPFRPNIDVPFAPVRIPISLEATSISEQTEGEIPQILSQESAIASDIQQTQKEAVSYTVVIFGIWMAGMLAILAFNLYAYRRFIASVRRWGVDVTDEKMNSLFRKVWKEMGLAGNPIALRECVFLSSPMLIGFREPTILLPEKTISSDELEYIFRHELTHYKRKDLLLNLLVLLASAAHWFNPFVYLMAKIIRADCEVACDEAVVAGKDADKRRRYGETIIGFIGTKNAMTPVLSTYFYGGKNSMKKRLTSIMEIGRKRKGLAVFVALAIITVTLLSGSVFATATKSGNTNQYITEAKAKSIALAHAGVPESQVVFIKARLERDDRRMIYDVEFYSGNVEYDYEIDAVNETILEFDRDIENYSIPSNSTAQSTTPPPEQQTTPQSVPNSTEYIGEVNAKSIALSAAGFSESQVSRMKVKLDREDGIMVYEIEFNNGRTEYEYEIDAVTGKIIKADVDYD